MKKLKKRINGNERKVSKTSKKQELSEFSNNYNESDDEEIFDSTVKKWYEEISLPPIEVNSNSSHDQDLLRKEAKSLFENNISNAFGKMPKSIPKSDYKWMKNMSAKGTLSDKIATYVLMIQDNPIANINHLQNLVSMVKVGKKRECFMTMDTLVQLFLENLLPPDRKLKFFSQQPLTEIKTIIKGDAKLRQRILLIWFFEDQLKSVYITFVKALNDAAHDSVDANKEKVIAVMQMLLQGHPEQEAMLLSNIVNKLGDPSHKIGSKVIYSLTKLLDSHPAMKGVVMEEVERVIFRPNMNKRAQYYSVCFLTQFSFDASDSQLANHLISIYFALFKANVKTGDVDSRMMSALLTGVSRAYPFVKGECVTLSEHINTVFKVVHLSNANVAIHALSLLFLVGGDPLSDRYINVLYRKVGERSMFEAVHHAIFLNIIFKSLKRESSESRVCAFIKRLLQISIHLSVPLIAGILILVSEVIQSRPKLSLQMIQETVSVPDFISEPNDDEEEKYVDVEGEYKSNGKIHSDGDIKPEPSSTSWFHASLRSKPTTKQTGQYDPYQRNPTYAAGDKAVPFELISLSRHYHPTVVLFANNILLGNKINYSGDPLQDFSLIRFLDKFVFKNPKQLKTSDNQVTTFVRFSRKKYYSSVGLKRLAVNSEEYLKQDEKIIPVDEAFMYRYLKEKKEIESKVKLKSETDDHSDGSDIESVGDEEFDNILQRVSGGGNDDLDFMKEVGQLPASEKDDGMSSDEDDEDIDGDENVDDEESDGMDDEGEPLEDIGSDEFDDAEELDDWGDEDNLSDDEIAAKRPKIEEKSNKHLVKGKKKKSKKTHGLFASAEEFAELLDEDNFQAGRSAALSNKDNSSMKQLKWEANQNFRAKSKNLGKNKRFGKIAMKEKRHNKRDGRRIKNK